MNKTNPKRLAAKKLITSILGIMLFFGWAYGQEEEIFQGHITIERISIPDSGGQQVNKYQFTIKWPRIMMEYSEPATKYTPRKDVKIVVDRDQNTVVNMVKRGKSSQMALIRHMEERRMETMFSGSKVREKREDKRVRKGAKMVMRDSTRIISDYTAQLATLKPVNRNHTFMGEVWVTDSINFPYYDLFNMPDVLSPPKESRIYDDNFFLLESAIRDTASGEFLLHKAVVKPAKISDRAFDIPAGYKVIDLETMETGYDPNKIREEEGEESP